jgi:SynChlorMet cassette protein ScmC
MVKWKISQCYSLKLADDWSWEIAASEEAQPWLEKFACTLQANACECRHGQKLIFVRNFLQNGHQDIISGGCKSPSADGWRIERIGNIKLFSQPGEPNTICDLGNEGVLSLEFTKMWQSLYPLCVHALDSGALPLHATFVELNGKGFAIAAPGGTGKSTCSRRIPPPWKSLSDDEILVVCDASGNYHAHPLPTWKEHIYYGSHRTWNVQRHIPLAGVFFLLRSEEDGAETIGNGKAAALMYRSASQVLYKNWRNLSLNDRNSVRMKTFQNACQIAEKIPSYFLRASLTGSFWEKMEEALGGGVRLP